MAARTKAIPRRPPPRQTRWLLWWPLVLALAATPVAVRYAEVLPLLGTPGITRLRILFPFAMLVHEPPLGLSEGLADALGRALLYAQFPLYGLLGSLVLQVAGLLRASITVLMIHGVGMLLVFLMAIV